ncbi:MAG: dihydroorotate dehydrogenase [Candidatus Eisenbacteria bacterium]|nr:dihydroorotate dehydrogenase [Candidatus Eisenbacteria bacterium]
MTKKIDLPVDLGKLKLKNPVLVASGTFGYGTENLGFVDTEKLGGVVTKTITLRPRSGNPQPRIFETASGVLNSIGLENIGLDRFLREKVPLLRRLRTSCIVSIGGGDYREFSEMASAFPRGKFPSAIEVNISCPNVKEGGISFGQKPALARRVLESVRKSTRLVLIAKLTPAVTSITEIAKACIDGGADILTIGNTFPGMGIDLECKEPAIGRFRGGLSGPAIKPLMLLKVWEVASSLDIPIIGCGGIMSGRDALEYFAAGASAVQIGTGALIDPRLPLRVLEEMREFQEETRADGDALLLSPQGRG